MQPTRHTLSIITGIALIVLPLVGLGLKTFSFGWMMVIVLFGPVLVLLAGYALQLVIAIQGFLSRGGAIPLGPTRRRATIAAWVTSIGIVALGIFMPDGGDVGYGSTFQVWLGAYSSPDSEALHAATDGPNGVLAWLAAIAWIGGYVWLFVEWVIGLSQRRRARLTLAEPARQS